MAGFRILIYSMVFLAFIFVLGLSIGSFLNVLIDRLPKEESVIKGRSHCEECKKTLKWYDLIPLFSFIFLQGKCRYCKTRLSLYYPIVELTTGILFALTALFILNNFQLVYYLFIVSSLIVIFFADLKYGMIPDAVLIFLLLVSLPYLLIINHSSFLINLYSGVGACLFFLILFLITKGKGMGFGDVKFAFLMGLILGFPNIVVALYVAFLTGAIVGIILILWRKRKIFGTQIPFGPFLVFGTFLTLFLGETIIQKIIPLLSH